MTTILISGSMKFKAEMLDLSNQLKDFGIENIIEPSNSIYFQEINLIEKAKNHEIFGNLIKTADLLIIYNKDGYVGLSTAMEIQKAIDSNVPVVFLFEPEAIEFKALCLHLDFNVRIENNWRNLF